MSRLRKYLFLAAAVNTIIFIGEAIGGVKGHSSSLLMDSVHNFSDELALIFLFLAFVLPVKMSKNFQRLSNVLNSIGIIMISVFVVWQSVERIFHPAPTVGYIPVIAGMGAAFANWGVAKALRPVKEQNAAIRLAYIHNYGDIFVSLAPVAAGLLIIFTGKSIFDPIIAIFIGAWLILTTIREIYRSYNELIWPDIDTGKESKPSGVQTA
jgi:cobalt-zinc-cadmium efflux system protein